mmetsp:Transcript_23227/g.40921  ORF Transcript_23227/g.40921 Transcript_23227/m.40921 type:complete len:204 (+) Transcript_23227:126-737(+)
MQLIDSTHRPPCPVTATQDKLPFTGTLAHLIARVLHRTLYVHPRERLLPVAGIEPHQRHLRLRDAVLRKERAVRLHDVNHDAVAEVCGHRGLSQRGEEARDGMRQVKVMLLAIQDDLVVPRVEARRVPLDAAARVGLEEQLHVTRPPRRRRRAVEAAEDIAVLVEDVVRVAEGLRATWLCRVVKMVRGAVYAVEAVHSGIGGV